MTILETEMDIDDMDEQVESICRWGAARAGVIVEIPVAGIIALKANDVYMITRMASVYGVKISESAIVSFVDALGGSLSRKFMSFISIIPMPVRIPCTAYAVGKAAQAWIKDGMPVDKKKYAGIFKSIEQKVQPLIYPFSKR